MRSEGLGARDEGRIFAVGEESKRPSCIVVVLLALLLLLSSCGYRLTPVGGIVPEGARTIAILTFVNGTNEPYVDLEVTRAVVDEFLADGRLKVVSSEAADLVLRGTVTKFGMTPAAYSPDHYVQSYTVSIGVNVSIEDARTHKLIWQETGVGSVFASGYGVTLGDITSTKTAKETALKSASRDVASTLRSRILEGF
jgi:hypothetical protein